MQQQRAHKSPKDYSQSKQAIYMRTYMASKSPEWRAARTAQQHARRRARLASDSEFRVAHSACNSKRLKERRATAELWPRMALNQIRTRAKREGIPFNLEPSDIAVPKLCPVLGIALRFGGGRNDMHGPSVDRLTPALGYIKGNVHVISRRANSIKNDAGSAELQQVADWCRRMGV